MNSARKLCSWQVSHCFSVRWKHYIFSFYINFITMPGETNHKITNLTGENLENEPRIMELRNQVNFLFSFRLFPAISPSCSFWWWNLSYFVITVQNYQNNGIGCCSGEIKWAREAKRRNVKALFPCFAFPKA